MCGDSSSSHWLLLMGLPLIVVFHGFEARRFRLFDIWKPGPVRWTEQRFHGGFGVVADDLTAGAMAAVPVWLLALATGPRAAL